MLREDVESLMLEIKNEQEKNELQLKHIVTL